MDIGLTPEHEELVDRTVSSGRYASMEEVISAALHLLDDEERWRKYVIEKIDRGLAPAEAGQAVSLEEVETRIDELRQQWVNKTKKKIAQSIAQLDAEEGITLDELQERLAKRRGK
jgi:antitoxin ParD1/3/4